MAVWLCACSDGQQAKAPAQPSASASAPRAKGVPPPPPEVAPLTLPTGRLQWSGVHAHGASFVDLDRTRKTGTGVDAVVLYVWEPGLQIAPGVLVKQSVSRILMDCTKDTYVEAGAQGFDASGVMLVWTERMPEEAIPTPSSKRILKDVECGHHKPDPTPLLIGHAAAYKAALKDIDKYRQLHPEAR